MFEYISQFLNNIYNFVLDNKFYFFAIIATLFWGISDVSFKKSTKPTDRYSHLKILIIIGFFMGLQAFHELYKLYSSGQEFSFRTLYIYFPISFLYILSMGIDFFGYRYLRISIGSPIASTSGVIAGILSWLVLGNELNIYQLLAIIVIGLGLVRLAYLEYKDSMEGNLGKNEIVKLGATALVFPLTYMVVDAIATFMDDYYMGEFLTEQEALISFELTFLFIGIMSFIYLFFIKKQKFNPFKPALIVGGLAETVGQFFYVFALAGDGAVTAPIMSLDGIVASILGVIILKEKINTKQKLVILAIGIAVAVLGYFE